MNLLKELLESHKLIRRLILIVLILGNWYCIVSIVGQPEYWGQVNVTTIVVTFMGLNSIVVGYYFYQRH
jgi:hypothetical protein